MKKLALIAKTSFLALAAATVLLPLSSCAGGEKADGTEAPAPAKSDDKSAPVGINIRYIDGDSVSAKYNLAKDFQEQSVRAFSKVESAQQAKATEIQKFASQVEQKMRNNGYLTEDSYNADMSKLNKMQQDAQAYLANLQRNTEQQLAQQQIELNDSLEAFIKDYNAKKGYDAILFKAAGVYFNPALDITDEVVEGLNARYNKTKSEK